MWIIASYESETGQILLIEIIEAGGFYAKKVLLFGIGSSSNHVTGNHGRNEWTGEQ
jgi:hypothetical protein